MRRDDMPAADDAAQLRRVPHSSEAEQSLLGSLLLDPACFDAISTIVRQAHLYRHEHRAIFGAIASLIAAHRAVDVVTVHDALRDAGQAEGCGGIAYLEALAQAVPSARNARRYAEVIREKAQRRAIIAAAESLAAAGFADRPVSELLEQGAADLATIGRETIAKAPRKVSDIAIARTQHYEDLEAGRVAPGWPTGLQHLDEMIGGGLRPGGLYILAARPKVGKSSLALALAGHLASSGHPALVLSQEMPDVEVVDRAVSSVGGIDYGSMTRGRMRQDDWSRACEALETLAAMPLWVDDEPALTLPAIRAKARQVQGLHVLVVDYLQLCAGSGRASDNRNSEIEELTRGLKALAKSDGLAVVALSQLNRDVEKRHNKRPQLSDLRDSGAIEQDADVVLMLWPHQQHEDGQRIVGCAVEANRQGQTGAIALHFDGRLQRWSMSSASLESRSASHNGGFA